MALNILTAIFAVSEFYALWTRKYQLVSFCAAAQFSYLVEPDITIYNSAAPQITLQLLLGALILGAILLFPSYYYLFRVFKSDTVSAKDSQN